MKSFLAILLFAPFIVSLHANDLDEYLFDAEVDGEIPDRHPIFGLFPLLPTHTCSEANGLEKREKSKRCERLSAETSYALFLQCSIDLYDCLNLGEKGKFECLKDYKTCMSVLIPTAPPPFLVRMNQRGIRFFGGHVIPSNRKRHWSDHFHMMTDTSMRCESFLGQHTIENQCKIDLLKCVKQGNKDKLECLKDYKTCISALMPTVPPYVETCFNNAIQCVKDKKNLAMKAGCLKELFVCIKDKGPEEVVFDAIEDMGQMENSNGFRKCQKDLYQCFKDENDGKICSANYKACMEALIPAYVKKCYAEAKECFGDAQSLKETFNCAKQLGKCLQNGAPTTSPPLPTEK
ncbi:unnamed protein product [Pocillopora meandrina]|uniref:Uncharacterized protein n=1 Tax=Pocillopora meandrina TaxID=46732 RepID=A0AAU9WP08_9CNID|nr:unnamed protein product [Pocillopora meandrina]